MDKNEEIDRTIYAALTINEVADRSPIFTLATVKQISEYLRKWRNVSSATADFRHFYHQILILSRTRPLFGIECNGKFYEFNILPMGFSWAPTIAQALSCLFWYDCIVRVGYEAKPIGGCDGIPPGWEIGNTRNGRWHMEAVIIMWYDNTVILARNQSVRNKLVAAATDSEANKWRLAWKRTADDNIFEFHSPYAIPFNGLVFNVAKQDSRQVLRWTHAANNIAGWSKKIAATKTCRNIASLIGVIMWDAQWRDQPALLGAHKVIAAAKSVQTTAKAVSENKHKRAKQHGDIDHEVPADLVAEVVARVTAITSEAGCFGEHSILVFTSYKGTVSDASTTFGGGAFAFTDKGQVDENTLIRCIPNWRDHGITHGNINILEAYIAVEYLIEIIPNLSALEIRHAIDNTTAQAWIMKGISSDEALSGRLAVL